MVNKTQKARKYKSKKYDPHNHKGIGSDSLVGVKTTPIETPVTPTKETRTVQIDVELLKDLIQIARSYQRAYTLKFNDLKDRPSPNTSCEMIVRCAKVNDFNISTVNRAIAVLEKNQISLLGHQMVRKEESKLLKQER